MSFPIVVTHPSTLFHNGLRQLFAKSRFRPVRIATALTEELESYLKSQRNCVWLTGIDKSIANTTTQVHKVVTENSGVKAIILAASHDPKEIAAALRAGACGFLCQDMGSETLLRSVELIALGEMIVHPQCVTPQRTTGQPCSISDSRNGDVCAAITGEPQLAQSSNARSPLPDITDETGSENQSGDVPSLSRREMLILRMLIQGASNKVIARTLVITESTVKVHMKAILRKLRLQNRTQAAIWARNHVNESAWNNQATAGSAH